jgi:hypothetical protein
MQRGNYNSSLSNYLFYHGLSPEEHIVFYIDIQGRINVWTQMGSSSGQDFINIFWLVLCKENL